MKLTAITANLHVFERKVNGKPIRLRIEFEGGKELRLQVAGNGQQMVIDNGPLHEPFEMGEFGRVESADVTQSIFPLLVGRNAASLNAMELSGQRIGLRLRMSEIDFYFWVDGDELFWGDDAALNSHNWLDGKKPETAEHLEI